MKRRLQTISIIMMILMLSACANDNYTVLTSLENGTIQIEYNGVIYIETGAFEGNHPPGEKVFHVKYKEVCDTVAYDAYLDGTTMYLIGRQPFWADVNAVNFILTAEDSTENS
jgi:hypothetical protein